MSQYAYTQDAETNAKKTAINTNRITISYNGHIKYTLLPVAVAFSAFNI